MTKAIAVLFALLACGFSNAQNYCNINSCSGRPHTACTYKSTQPGPKCTGAQGVGLSKDEKQRILNLHNELRQKVASGQEKQGKPGPQPGASNMANLEWDSELEEIAQRWASQCQWGHDQCRDVALFSVGQNIAYMGTTANVNTIKPESMVMSWYNEVKDFSKNDVSNFKGSNGAVVGHYTQLVWAKTTKLGCGAMKYKEGGMNKFYLVCNYGPAGNWMGEPLYQSN